MIRAGQPQCDNCPHSYWSICQESNLPHLILIRICWMNISILPWTLDFENVCNLTHFPQFLMSTSPLASCFLTWEATGFGRKSNAFIHRLFRWKNLPPSLGITKTLIVPCKAFQHLWHPGRSRAWGVWRGRPLKWSVVYKMHHFFLYIHLHLVHAELLKYIPKEQKHYPFP